MGRRDEMEMPASVRPITLSVEMGHREAADHDDAS